MSGEIRASLGGESRMRSSPEERRARRARGGFANAAEDAFATAARANGWYVNKRGWPDFWCVQPDGSLAVVEVKPKRSVGLKPQQTAVLQRLAALGIPAYTWNPRDGFKKVKP
jgi:hypothetical protein